MPENAIFYNVSFSLIS